MTKIEYQATENEFTMTVKGHAGFAALGNDIVCAAVSVLVQTLLLHAGEHIREALITPGKVYMHGEGKEAVSAFYVILTGLESVSESYPDYVQIEGCPINRDDPLK